MIKLRSIAAQELVTQLQFVLAREQFIEARLFITYSQPGCPHLATLALYNKPSTDDLHDSIFQGDVAEMEFDLTSIGPAKTNRRFINDLAKAVSPHWRYLSKRLNLGFDTEGFEDVSARFAIEDLINVLPIK
jgi:hypothetical protein